MGTVKTCKAHSLPNRCVANNSNTMWYPRRWENRVRWFSWVTRTSYHVWSSVITDLTVRPRCSGSRNEPGTGRAKYPRVRWMVRCLVAEWQSAWTACGILKSRTHGFSHKLNTHSWRGYARVLTLGQIVSTIFYMFLLYLSYSYFFLWDSSGISEILRNLLVSSRQVVQAKTTEVTVNNQEMFQGLAPRCQMLSM